MREDILRVIRCPDIRCKECSELVAPYCSRLSLLLEEKTKEKVIILEASRSLLHLGGISGPIPTRPPWKGEGWESIYIGNREEFPDKDWCPVDAYLVGPYLSFYYLLTSEKEVFHRSYPLVRTSLEYGLLQKLSESIENEFQEQAAKRTNISVRLQQIANSVSRDILTSLPEISKTTRERISRIVANKTTVLGTLLPILLDDDVEEVYMDRPRKPIYFDHCRLGRCISKYDLHHDDVPRFATLLRAESNLHLDRRNPSLKTDLNLLDMNLRVSASLPPLSPDGLHLEIRRARRRPFTILDLIRNGTLPTEAAAALLLALGCRFNITITGGPGTGKTTLLNALDLDSPKVWRKIYIEDAMESRNLENHHQVRFKVDPVDEIDGHFDKSIEIVKTLHRSPDYVILGEIQTAEHSQALFQAIAAGLRAMQTCHSNSAASLMSRWTTGHAIEKSSLAMMDLIVTLVRPVPGESIRRVSEIVEVRRAVSEGVLEFNGLSTVYNYHSSQDLQWAPDGAYLSYAREAGHESHIQAYNAIVDSLTRSLQTSVSDTHRDLAEEIWSQVHPLRSAGV
ncbi:MAG: ATPase, T2SS/T4P/T4SS family [Candidatus Thorarchaeota archaeon]|jgi:Flp pilus assembly CpaF family ATPase